MFSLEVILGLQNVAVCGGCCWYCYSEVPTRAVISESASNYNVLGNLCYFDCSFSHTQMCCVFKHSSHPNVHCSAWSCMSGRNNGNGTVFRWLLHRRLVIFSPTLEWPWRHPYTVLHTVRSVCTRSLLANPDGRWGIACAKWGLKGKMILYQILGWISWWDRCNWGSSWDKCTTPVLRDVFSSWRALLLIIVTVTCSITA